jgi:hypothetical protein
LEELYLSRNALSGPLPDAFGESKLRALYAYGQAGEGLAGERGARPALVGARAWVPVWLHGNSALLRPATWTSLPLRAHAGPLPPSLALAPALSFVNLAGNHLDGEVLLPPQLRAANLSSNSLSGQLPGMVSEQAAMLDLSGNVLEGTLPAVFSKLQVGPLRPAACQQLQLQLG